MSVSYDVIRKKFPDVFCLDNLRRIHKRNQDDIIVSFVDFLMYAEDYYLIKYAGKLSKTAWWLFSLLKGLVRRDGYVKLSYSDIMAYYCIDGKSAISKPTFFKYVDELESFGLVRRYNNKKFFGTGYQNDSNTYVVISCAKEILDICREVAHGGSFRELVLESDNVAPVMDNVSDKPKKQINKNADMKAVYEDNKSYYEDCWSTIEDFFEFLGEGNKSGRISLSRKAKILSVMRDIDVDVSTVEYAVSQTIKRGIRSEKYFLKIIKNIYDDSSNDTQDVSGVQSRYMNREPNRECMSKERYIKERGYMLEDLEYHKYIIEEFDSVDERDMNDYERKLYRAARVLEHKAKAHKEGKKVSTERRMLLEEKYGIYERQRIEKNHDRTVTWFYDVERTKMVPIEDMRKIKRKHKDLFKMYKYMYPDGRYYDGL